MVDVKTTAETWTPSMKRCEINAMHDYIMHGRDVLKGLDANFKFPKIHFTSHLIGQIR
jgi:hypothetical protein